MEGTNIEHLLYINKLEQPAESFNPDFEFKNRDKFLNLSWNE